MPPQPPKSAVHKPLKRPSQARARFTVQAIYDGMVRIWLRDGPDAVTTKAVAAETGFAVGTLYDYFPNRTALFSGYVRHCIDDLLRRLDEDALAARALPWPERLSRMVRMTCGADGAAPCFDHAMLMIEHAIAEDKHHRRVYEELSGAWVRIIQTWPDLPPGVDARRIRSLFVTVLGTRRYVLLVEPTGPEIGDWVAGLEAIACRMFDGGSSKAG